MNQACLIQIDLNSIIKWPGLKNSKTYKNMYLWFSFTSKHIFIVTLKESSLKIQHNLFTVRTIFPIFQGYPIDPVL
jgi:hypothetical protein